MKRLYTLLRIEAGPLPGLLLLKFIVIVTRTRAGWVEARARARTRTMD
jgi:hypothetical protein